MSLRRANRQLAEVKRNENSKEIIESIGDRLSGLKG